MEEIFIDKIIPGGQALGTMKDGRKIFFWNALPGETVVQYEITKQKAHYVEAVATKIKDASSHRVEPRDVCFLATSPWQMMEFKYEQRLKGELVQEVFRQNQIKIEAPEVVTDGKEYGYRNKMEYSLYYDFGDEQIHLAFHQRGSHRKVPIKQSSIERPEIFAYAKGVVDDLNARGEEARKYQSLLLRCNQAGEVSGGLFENHQPHPVFENLKDMILKHEYSYSPNGFFQINLPVYEMALAEIKKYVEPGFVLDLYSGVGTIGLSVAENAVLIESNKAAYMEAVENAKNTGARAVLAKSEEALDYIEPDMTVIVDPPRAGCDVKLIEKLLEVRPKKIIYLSCNPATQARDVKMLLEKYQIEAVKAFNFFPRTPHIENLVVLK